MSEGVRARGVLLPLTWTEPPASLDLRGPRYSRRLMDTRLEGVEALSLSIGRVGVAHVATAFKLWAAGHRASLPCLEMG